MYGLQQQQREASKEKHHQPSCLHIWDHSTQILCGKVASVHVLLFTEVLIINRFHDFELSYFAGTLNYGF